MATQHRHEDTKQKRKSSKHGNNNIKAYNSSGHLSIYLSILMKSQETLVIYNINIIRYDWQPINVNANVNVLLKGKDAADGARRT